MNAKKGIIKPAGMRCSNTGGNKNSESYVFMLL